MSHSTPAPILASLRAATQETHERLEAGELSQTLISPTLRQDKYVRILIVFGSWFVAAEKALQEHQEWIATELDEGRFQRESWLREDLPRQTLRFPTLPSIPKEEVLGWLYVLEGSTLGGKKISRHLTAREEASGESWPTRFFEAYGAETGPRWQRFLQFLSESIPEGHPHYESVLKGANDAFESFRSWQVSCLESAAPPH